MDKEKLIAAMQEAVAGYTNVHHGKVIEICAEAALKELGNEWVRVEDRLPEDMEFVLFTVGALKTYYIGWRETTPRVTKTGWFADGLGEWHEDAEVTHWQPLPSPPKQ